MYMICVGKAEQKAEKELRLCENYIHALCEAGSIGELKEAYAGIVKVFRGIAEAKRKEILEAEAARKEIAERVQTIMEGG